MTASSLGLTDHQYQNALGIITAVKARNWPIKAAYIATETALAESGLQVYANANVPASLNLPHDAVGYDHASVGIFQQQTPMWGTVAACMNPTTSTAKFLDALARVPWQSTTNWAAAQAVQISAYADGSNYQKQDARAQQIVNALWATTEDDMTKAEMQQLLTETVGKWLATVLYGDVDAKTGASANNGGATGPNTHPVNLTAALYRIEQLEKKVGA